MIPQLLVVYYPYNQEETCSICLEYDSSMIAHTKVLPLDGGPYLRCPVHEECLKTWLKQVRQNPHCPTCRTPVDLEQLPSYLRKRKIQKIRGNVICIACISLGLSAIGFLIAGIVENINRG